MREDPIMNNGEGPTKVVKSDTGLQASSVCRSSVSSANAVWLAVVTNLIADRRIASV